MSNNKIENESFNQEDAKVIKEIQKELSEYTNYDNIQNPYNFKSWWGTLSSCKEAPFKVRKKLYEISLHYLPGSYKLWNYYLRELRAYTKKNYQLPNVEYNRVNLIHERSLIYMLKMPVIWIEYIKFLMEQKLVTKTRQTFDLCLQMLPVTQHKKIWDIMIPFIENLTVCNKMKVEILSRYIQFNQDYLETYIRYLIGIKEFKIATKYIFNILNNENFFSKEGKTKYYYWLLLCQIIDGYPEAIDKDYNIEKIIRYGLNIYKEDIGKLWVTLANYYTKIGDFDKTRETYEEALESIITINDFSLIYNSYLNFEQEYLKNTIFNEEEVEMENDDINNINETNLTKDEINLIKIAFEDLNIKKSSNEKIKNIKKKNDSDENNYNFVKVNNLIERRPFLINATLLRKNPNNVEEWLKKIDLLKRKKNDELTIKTYEEALKSIDINKTLSNLSDLYFSYAKFYLSKKEIDKANEIFYKGCTRNYIKSEENIYLWCVWVETHLKLKNFENAYKIISSVCNNYKYNKYNKNLKLWSLYVDLEENINKDKNKVIFIYNKLIDYKIANVDTIFNYITFLEKNKLFEESFQIYERSIDNFIWPNLYDIYICYIDSFINFYKGRKLERTRDIINSAINSSNHMKIFYYIYGFYEEKYGFYNDMFNIFKKGTQNIKENEKPEMYSVLISKITKYSGISKTRTVFDDALNNLNHEYILEVGLKYASIEIKLNEIERARGIFKYIGQLINPDNEENIEEFWNLWENFENIYGNEETIKDLQNTAKIARLKNL